MNYSHRFTFINGVCSNSSKVDKKSFSKPYLKAWAGIRNYLGYLYLLSRVRINIEKSVIKKINSYSDKISRK